MNDTTNMSRYAEQSDVSPVSPADPLERYAQYPFDSDETYKVWSSFDMCVKSVAVDNHGSKVSRVSLQMVL